MSHLTQLLITVVGVIVDNPPRFRNVSFVFYISENSNNGDEVGSVEVTDDGKFQNLADGLSDLGSNIYHTLFK